MPLHTIIIIIIIVISVISWKFLHQISELLYIEVNETDDVDGAWK